MQKCLILMRFFCLAVNAMMLYASVFLNKILIALTNSVYLVYILNQHFMLITLLIWRLQMSTAIAPKTKAGCLGNKLAIVFQYCVTKYTVNW